MKKLRYICVQPRIMYYTWQVEVMINNFIRNGISGNDMDILVAWNPNDLTNSSENIEAWNKLANKYNYVRFFFYEDSRQQPVHYISSIRPNILKQHWLANPELVDDAIFYHDCDIIFTKPLNFSNKLMDDVWYLSDTNSYINYDYIISKGKDVYDKMCEIIGMNPIIPKLMNSNSGGAQYLLKNVDYSFWNKVEKDCEKLFYEINSLNDIKKKTNSEYHELQIWCADMWSVLWNAWLMGHETKVDKDLDFCWASDNIQSWNDSSIFHNAGVTVDMNHLFYKSEFQNKLPYNIEADKYSKDYCSYNYVSEIIETSKISCLI